ncbi:MAG: glucosamine-6-phosphate deaminase [Lachnospiraceae bacterium]|nr:glucosamine-6-phosphate deaminase [Lachnospiraceae bacterium]
MEFVKDELAVKLYPNRAEMGKGAAHDVAECIRKCLKEKEEINMIFAAAPSQNDVLASLLEEPGIEWERINAFHMDEYIGLPENAPQRFAEYLRGAIFSHKPFRSINYMNAAARNAEAECERYTKLLKEHPVDIVCMGIGENGHIAFNDPHVAEFKDKKWVKQVELDLVCRNQQVHDGCFETLEDVPEYALTLTIPALMAADYHFCVVPAPSKAEAVKRTVCGDISEECPATILRTKKGSVLYCDADSSRMLRETME